MIKKWLKSIILQCLKESLKEQPLIISSRAPCSDDVYESGTIWKHGNDIYIAKKITVEWEKQE